MLTVRDAKVVDIVGFEDKAEALTYNATTRAIATNHDHSSDTGGPGSPY